MNHKKRLFKQRMRRVMRFKIFHEYLNDHYRRHTIFKMVCRGKIAVDRIIEKQGSLIVKAHDIETKNKILLSLSETGRTLAFIEQGF